MTGKNIFDEFNDSDLTSKLLYDSCKELFDGATEYDLLRASKLCPPSIWYMTDEQADELYIAHSLIGNHGIFSYTYDKFKNKDYVKVFKYIYKFSGERFFIQEKNKLKKAKVYDIAMLAIGLVINEELEDGYNEYCHTHNLTKSDSLLFMWKALNKEKYDILDKVREIGSYYTFNICRYNDDKKVITEKSYGLTDEVLGMEFINIANKIIETHDIKRERSYND